MTELVTFGETPLRLSPPGVQRLETAGEVAMEPAGTESSVAVAAACLGAECTWISRLPETPPGKRIARTLEGHGVDTAVSWVDDGEGRVGVTYHEDAAEPRSPGTWYDRENTTAAGLAPGDAPIDLAQDAAVVFGGASTASLAEGSFETTQALLRAGASEGATTAMDLDHRPGHLDPDHVRECVLRLVENLDVLVANEETARRVFDRKGQARDLANSLVADHGLEMVVITRGELGAVVMHDSPGTNVIHERETIESEAVDEAGQHEALVGGFLQRLIAGADAAEALSYGVAMAALARTVPGPLLSVDPDEVDRVVDDVVSASR